MHLNDEKVNKKIKQFVIDNMIKDYGIEEEDFVTAEHEVVPAGKLWDVGLA